MITCVFNHGSFLKGSAQNRLIPGTHIHYPTHLPSVILFSAVLSAVTLHIVSSFPPCHIFYLNVIIFLGYMKINSRLITNFIMGMHVIIYSCAYVCGVCVCGVWCVSVHVCV